MNNNKRKSIEVYIDDEFTITETPEGTKIHGRLAYPGISKNLKLYTIDQLMGGHNKYMDVWLNHADAIGIGDIGPDLLPDEYRDKLLKNEKIILGKAHTMFDANTLELLYEAIITDPFYKQKKVLEKMSVSQGVFHPRYLPQHCDTMFCYTIIKDSVYDEISLVFHAGFSIATISIEHDNTYNLENILHSIMSDNNKTKSDESDCGCNKSTEEQAAGIMSAAGNCGEGMMYDVNEGRCVPVNEGGNNLTNASPGPNDVSGENTGSDADGRTIGMFGKVEKAQEKLSKAQENLKKSREALEKAKEELDVINKKAKEAKDEDEYDKPKEKKTDEGYEVPEGTGPNADTGSRARAQEAYNKKLEEHYKSIESMTLAADAATKATMAFAKENAVRTASIGSNTSMALVQKSIEAAHMGPKRWIDNLIKGVENTPWNKTWSLDGHYTDAFVKKAFKTVEGAFLTDTYKSYEEIMGKLKAAEAGNVAMAGGVDPNNFQRTMSELVLVYPDGNIVTPIQQFCETAILAPGKKQHLFYDVNIPSFAATDEANMDAGGGGYALVASDITVNASGGKTSPQGGLVRIPFTDLEELPIDIIQKVNIGFAMRAEERKNFEVLTTCYNDDTAYNPATDAIKPKGGGAKTAQDSKGNRHWVNGNSGAEITSSDSGATAALTFLGLLKAKSKIGNTGLAVQNLQTYLPYDGILQVIQDAAITTYLQRSVPEVITEGYIEKIAGTQLIASSSCAPGATATIARAVMFLPVVSFGFVTGRELQVDAERVARQQSVFATASLKMAAFCKKLESTCRISFTPSA